MPELVDPVQVSSAEREVAVEEVRAVLASAGNPAYREELEGLVEALETGLVDGEHAPALDRIVSLGLQSGRIRHVYGPGGEQAALRLYRKLPEGRAVQATAGEVGEALSSLAGRTLDSVSISPLGPGTFSVAIAADGIQLSVRLDRQGARLHSVEA